MKKLIFNLVLVCSFALVASSCSHHDDEIVKPAVENIENNKIMSQNPDVATKALLVDCSFPFDGSSKGWTQGTFNLGTDQFTNKKYTWTTNGSIMNSSLGTRLQFKIMLQIPYPIVVRVIGKKSGESTILQTCYAMSSAYATKSYDFYIPTHTGTFGQLISDYDNYDFEVIVYNRNYTGNPQILIPVKVTLCKSGGGSCAGYPAF